MITQMSRRAAGVKSISMEREYLTFVPLEDEGCTFSFTQRGTGSEEHPTIEYSIDKGVWTALTGDGVEATPTVAKGHEVRWRGEIVPVSNNETFSNFEICGIGVFSSSGEFRAYGNPLSVRRLNFRGSSPTQWTYCALFNNSSIVDASGVYISDTLASACCTAMFYGCKSLVSPPQLPATTLATACYQGMFRNCISLATSPGLPATKLSARCYRYMYQGCTSLISAPDLPATTLTTNCYTNMFYNCSVLTYIKMLAVDTSATNCLSNWVRGVASDGTFVKNAAKTDLPTGDSGIPSGWTVEDDPSTVTE